MSSILTTEEHIALHETKSNGTHFISRTSSSTPSTTSATRSSPVPFHNVSILDGVYRIVQRIRQPSDKEQSASIELDACVSATPSDGGQDFAVTMAEANAGCGGEAKLSLWRINRAHGTEDGYFIVPYGSPAQDTDADVGLTTYNDLERVYVTWSPTYLVWNIVCNERLTFRKNNEALEDKLYFRLSQLGTTGCWTTSDNYEIRIEGVNEQHQHTQLYELLPLVPRDYLSLLSHKFVSLFSPDGNIHRKLWISTAPLSKSDLSRIDSVQLFTDAHDQGWAGAPQEGVWTWFEICILSTPMPTGDTFDEKYIKRDKDGKLLTFHSHSTYLSDVFKTQSGKLFSRETDLWGYIEPGDAIGVLACAQYSAWMAEGRKVELVFRELVPAVHD